MDLAALHREIVGVAGGIAGDHPVVQAKHVLHHCRPLIGQMVLGE
jgi:hypothetical protein